MLGEQEWSVAMNWKTVIAVVISSAVVLSAVAQEKPRKFWQNAMESVLYLN
jgi:hypothetical protein